MTDDVRFSVLRRKLLPGLGAAAMGGVATSAVGRAAPQALRKRRAALSCRRSLHSTSLIRCSTSGTWRRCLNGYSATGSC